MSEETPKVQSGKKRELTSPEFEIDTKKNKFVTSLSDLSDLSVSDSDNSLLHVEEPCEHPISDLTTDPTTDLSATISSTTIISTTESITMASSTSGDQMETATSQNPSEIPSDESTSHITIPPSEMMKISQLLKDTFRGEIVELVNSVVDGVLKGLYDKMVSLETANSSLLQENTALSKRVSVLEKQVEQGEQYSRRNNLRISGLVEDTETQENTDDIVMKMAADIGSDIQLVDVDRSHRVGDPKRARARPREIIVKFATYRSRQNFYKHRTSLKDNGYQGVFINEDLTKSRSNLLYEARQLYKSGQLKGAWSADGNILVKDNDDKIQRVSEISDLDKFKTVPPVLREFRAMARRSRRAASSSSRRPGITA